MPADDITISRQDLASLAFQCAGAGAAAIMSKPGPAGEVVMPTEEIGGAVRQIVVGQCGFDIKDVEGYRGLEGS